MTETTHILIAKTQPSKLPHKMMNKPSYVKENLEFLLKDNACESMYAFALDNALNIISYREVFRGSINSSIANPREIFQFALLSNASKIIVAHNHPSGNTKPSPYDIDLTRRLKYSGDILSLPLIDHVIIGDDMYSFRDNNVTYNIF